MTTLHPGIAPDSYAVFECPRKQYDDIVAINQSLLKEMDRSPAHFRFKQTAPKEAAADAVVSGNLVEMFTIGTPFEYVLSPFKDFKTKESQAWRDEQKARGVAVVRQSMIDTAHQMAGRILGNEWFKACKPFRTNIAMVARHEETGLLVKGLADFAPDNDLCIGDIKKTQDASPTEHGFGRSIVTYGMDIQGAVYQWLWKQVFGEERTFVMLPVEEDEPHVMSIQALRQSQIDPAWRKFETWLRLCKQCQDSGEWPEYAPGITWCQIPAWRFRE